MTKPFFSARRMGTLRLTLPVMVLLFSTSLAAYEIRTGLSDSCHEDISLKALKLFFESNVFEANGVPMPDNTRWEDFGDALLEESDVHIEDPQTRFMAYSLIFGARWPDELGLSVTSTEALYSNHGDPYDQHEHFLRGLDDDGVDGDAAAVGRSTAFIAERISAAREYMNRPARSQLITITEYVEYYGQVTIEVWAPAWYLGTALHALQDSFSHTVRSDDLRQIYHVLNFVDAVTDEYDPHRDGLAHSYAMDACDGSTAEIVEASSTASLHLLDFFTEDGEALPDDLFAAWLVYAPGCTAENHFCDSKWLSLVQTDTTEPILQSVFSCSAIPGKTSGGALLAGVFVFFLMIAVVRRKSHERR